MRLFWERQVGKFGRVLMQLVFVGLYYWSHIKFVDRSIHKSCVLYEKTRIFILNPRQSMTWGRSVTYFFFFRVYRCILFMLLHTDGYVSLITSTHPVLLETTLSFHDHRHLWCTEPALIGSPDSYQGSGKSEKGSWRKQITIVAHVCFGCHR